MKQMILQFLPKKIFFSRFLNGEKSKGKWLRQETLRCISIFLKGLHLSRQFLQAEITNCIRPKEIS